MIYRAWGGFNKQTAHAYGEEAIEKLDGEERKKEEESEREKGREGGRGKNGHYERCIAATPPPPPPPIHESIDLTCFKLLKSGKHNTPALPFPTQKRSKTKIKTEKKTKKKMKKKTKRNEIRTEKGDGEQRDRQTHNRKQESYIH